MKTLNHESTSKCYVCGRDEKEFVSILNPSDYDKEISLAESEISRSLSDISKDIKLILKRTENYDGELSIREMMHSEGISAKFVPEWKLLLKYLTPETVADIRIKGAPMYTVSTIRAMLSNAVKELDNGNHPAGVKEDEHIYRKEKELRELRLKKEGFEHFIANPGFKTYQTKLKVQGQNGNITVKYKLCPICSDLHTTYHNSITDNENDDNQGWDD